MSLPVDCVIEFLEAERARGKSHVYLDDESRTALRELFLRTRVQPVSVVVAAPEVSVATVEVVVSGSNKMEQLAGLREQASCWAPGIALGTLREKMVFGMGNPDAEIFLIGEAPAHNEEKDGEPFTGPAGQKLNDILKAMGLSRESVYLTNLVKFRPAMARQTTNNRKPSAQEMAVFAPFIMAEIAVVQPKVIIVLGNTAAEGLMGLEGTVPTLRGKWHELAGIPARVTYHPSYLLQTGSNEVKRHLWEDMLAAMEKIGLPISEKQRGFFVTKG